MYVYKATHSPIFSKVPAATKFLSSMCDDRDEKVTIIREKSM